MRMANIIEAVLFMTAFMLVLLVVATDRSARRVPATRVASLPVRKPRAQRQSVAAHD